MSRATPARPQRDRPVRWRAAVTLCAGLLLCNSGFAADATAPPATAASTVPRVEIEAPSALKALLSRHLDLARLAQMGEDEPLEISEWLRLMAAAPAQARELLQTEGYFEPDISIVREPGLPLHLRLRVLPGPRIRIAQIDVRAEGDLLRRLATGDGGAAAAAASLSAAGPLRVGHAFRNAAWSETKVNWASTLRVAGYAAASLRHSVADIDVAAGVARLEAVLDSGPLFLAGPLRVEGLKSHDLSTVRHLADFGPGQPLTEALLLDTQDRLQKVGLFEAVSVGFDAQVDQAAATPVVVKLRELPLQQATVGLGTSSDTGPRLSLSHIHRRPFGWAVTASNKLEWGQQSQRWAGDLLTHSGQGFTRYLLGTLIERERSDTDIVLSQRLRLGRTQDTPAIERLVFAEALRSRQSVVGGETFDAQAFSGSLHLVLRRLDSVLLPTRGVALSLQLGAGLARSTQGESGPFGRVLGRLTGYLPLGSQWLAKARLEAGQIIKRDAVLVPDALGFRAGGDESVRGYAYRSLAPSVNGRVVSGNTLLTASLEVARPIMASLPSVLGAVFVDAGRAADRWPDFKPAIGYGVGVRWNGPIGPVRVDLAWADELRKLRLHLSVGVTF